MTKVQDLVIRLIEAVPAVDDVPTSGQYARAVRDAVVEFSRRCGLGKIATLSIVSGTATYSLPADFLKLISLDALVGVDGVIVSQSGLIPLSKDFEEEYTISNKQITFFPTPGYSMTRYFKYKAAWVETAADYTSMGDDEAEVVMLKAKAIATEKIYKAQASTGVVEYSLGAVSVKKGDGISSLKSDFESLEKQFDQECDRYNGQTAMYA